MSPCNPKVAKNSSRRVAPRTILFERRRELLHSDNRGQAALISLLTIGAIVLVLGVSIAVRGSISVLSSQRSEKSDNSFFAAQAGIDDALDRIARNKDFAVGDGNNEYSDNATCQQTDTGSTRTEYLVSIGSANACVEVKATLNSRERTITSRSTFGGTSKTIVMTVEVHGSSGDPDNPSPADPGKIDIISWEEQ